VKGWLQNQEGDVAVREVGARAVVKALLLKILKKATGEGVVQPRGQALGPVPMTQANLESSSCFIIVLGSLCLPCSSPW